MAQKVVLDVRNVTKQFGERKAVNNVSFKIREGEIFGFLGPNGAGKTTTMKMICGLSKLPMVKYMFVENPLQKKKSFAYPILGL